MTEVPIHGANGDDPELGLRRDSGGIAADASQWMVSRDDCAEGSPEISSIVDRFPREQLIRRPDLVPPDAAVQHLQGVDEEQLAEISGR